MLVQNKFTVFLKLLNFKKLSHCYHNVTKPSDTKDFIIKLKLNLHVSIIQVLAVGLWVLKWSVFNQILCLCY